MYITAYMTSTADARCPESVCKLRQISGLRARRKDSEGTPSCACNIGRDNKMGKAQIMDDVQTLFCLTDADGCREMRCQRVS